MMFNYRYLNLCTFILITIFVSLSNAAFCSNLTSIDDKDKPCFLEPPSINPSRLRSSGNSLVLPCHVARSKRATIEWWYQDFQKSISIKVYPVISPVRPTVLRFITSISPISKTTNETDIIDVSILLRNVNVDDSGIYRCVIRPWIPPQVAMIDNNLLEPSSDLPSLTYHIELTAPRLCQASLGTLPCFSNMRTSSPTFIDAYQAAFLQCVVNTYNRPVTVFWVVGNASANSVLITDYLTSNQHNGDRLRRMFPLSPFDYSIELIVNGDIRERTYSCVIDGSSDVETTLFTYIVRSIDVEDISDKTVKPHKNETIVTDELESESETETETSTIKNNKIVAHDALTAEQIDELRHKKTHEHSKKKHKKLKSDDDDDDALSKKKHKNLKSDDVDNDDDLLDFDAREEAKLTPRKR